MNSKLDSSAAWIDATYPIFVGMPVWPEQPEIEVSKLSTIDEPGDANVSFLGMSAHTGTHLDAPDHYIDGDDDVSTAPIDLMTGEARVAVILGDGHITEQAVRDYEDRSTRIKPGERILFRSRNSDTDWTKKPFTQDYAAIAPDAAKLLVERQVDLVGVDYLSVAPFDDPATTHRILLHASIWVIEGLDLRVIDEGRYDMIGAPLKIMGSDASPLRVLLRPQTTGDIS